MAIDHDRLPNPRGRESPYSVNRDREPTTYDLTDGCMGCSTRGFTFHFTKGGECYPRKCNRCDRWKPENGLTPLQDQMRLKAQYLHNMEESKPGPKRRLGKGKDWNKDNV